MTLIANNIHLGQFFFKMTAKIKHAVLDKALSTSLGTAVFALQCVPSEALPSHPMPANNQSHLITTAATSNSDLSSLILPGSILFILMLACIIKKCCCDCDPCCLEPTDARTEEAIRSGFRNGMIFYGATHL